MVAERVKGDEVVFQTTVSTLAFTVSEMGCHLRVLNKKLTCSCFSKILMGGLYIWGERGFNTGSM